LPFASFFVSSSRDTTASFHGYLRGLFQSERANMLCMSEVNEVDHQAMQYMLTEGAVDWAGFSEQITRETNILLGDPESVLIFNESGFAKKGKVSAGVARVLSQIFTKTKPPLICGHSYPAKAINCL
jgi:SRSO17 transposase